MADLDEEALAPSFVLENLNLGKLQGSKFISLILQPVGKFYCCSHSLVQHEQ